jgi:GNAT superfamily N-acetyltransferase
VDRLTEFSIHPVTPGRWPDLEVLFGPRGACAGCWCMFWRLPRKDFEAGSGSFNRAAFKGIIESGEIPGLIAYHEDKPAGWVCVGPRSDFPVLARSRVLKPVDELPVWSVVCFFVARPFRRQGLTVSLLDEAVRFAAEHRAEIVEGYPIATKSSDTPAVFIYTGTASAFTKAGFVEVARRSETRPIMRYWISK